MSTRKWMLVSPVIMVVACHLVARVASAFIGKWAFIPVMLCIWLVAFIFIRLSGTEKIKGKWLKKVEGKYLWKTLVILVGLLPLPVFLMHWHLLDSAAIIIPYVLIAVINPFFEEFYFRGTLMDALDKVPNWIAVLYTSFFFALNHPLSFGMFSELNSGYTVFIATFIMGVVWAVGYKKIGNLRAIIFAHFLVDTFNMSVPAFLDLYKATF